MADDSIAETSEIELEFKRKTDNSWHPCQVSLCPGGGISVKFDDQASEDIILDVEGASAYLRVRSVPLQGDDCCYIEEGKHVLAACEDSHRLFFDAVVQKAVRVRHSKRASCRCTFMVKWLFEHAKKEISCIPSSSIRRLATESINAHPAVAAFINSKEKSYLSPSSSSFTALDEVDNEIDLHGLLKHIEGIGSLTSASKELLNHEVNDGVKDGHKKLVASEQESKCVQVSCGRSSLRRSARRQNVPQPTIEDSIISAPSSLEKPLQHHSPLSPLASRAALASLMSKLPEKVESVLHEDKKCVSVLDFPFSDCFSGCNGILKVNKVESLVTNNREYSGMKLHAQKSNESIVGLYNKFEPSSDSGSTLSFSMNNKESTLPLVKGRLTRASMKRKESNKNQDENSTSVKETIQVRVTRSLAHKGKENLAEKPNEEFQDNVRSTRSTCSALNTDTEISDVDDKIQIPDEVAKCIIVNSAIRVTRSTARAGTVLLEDRAKELLQDKPDTAGAHYSGNEAMISARKRKRTFSAVEAELKSAESDKKQTDLNFAVDDFHGNGDGPTRKPISSNNNLSRHSPRLRFSPRTRSHDKP